MVYAVSAHNNLDSLWIKLPYSNTFPSPIYVHINIQVFQSCKPVSDFNLILFFDFNINSFLTLNHSIPKFYSVCLLTDHGIVHPQVVDGGEGLQIWRVAANILHKQLHVAYKGWSSNLDVACGANNNLSP
jgi:hypothetical protein